MLFMTSLACMVHEQPMQLIIFNYLQILSLLALAFADTAVVCQQPFAPDDNV